jgi:hypothetical protein
MGKRRGFIVTSNYPGIPGAQLAGCDNDGTHVEQYLESVGFDEVTRLRDQEATRANIESSLQAHVLSLGADDLLVFHYSGHGTEGSISLTPGALATKHEGLVPYDFRTSGILWDARTREILSLAHRFARVVVILDSCFAGGMFRFAAPLFDGYRAVRYLPPDAWLRKVDVDAEVGRFAGDAAAAGVYDDRTARQVVLDEIAKVSDQRVDKAYPVVLLAASKPGQVAWCGEADGVAVGAFTTALLRVARGQRRDGTTTRPPRDYLEAVYGGRDLEGVTTVRADRPGWLPTPDAPQDPTLHGTPGRVTWPWLAA